MKLASHLGKSLSWVESLSEMEFRKWMAFYEIEPFGEERMDLRFALMTAHLISPYLPKGSKAMIKDYLLTFEKKEQSWKAMKKILKSTCSPDNIKVKDG